MKKNLNKKTGFKEGDCIVYNLSEGVFGGAIVYQVNHNSGLDTYFFLITSIQSQTEPTLEDFISSETFGRKEKNYLDDILLIWQKYLPDFEEHFKLIGNLNIVKNGYKLGAYRHQSTFDEFEFSISKLSEIDYMERASYPVQSFIASS